MIWVPECSLIAAGRTRGRGRDHQQSQCRDEIGQTSFWDAGGGRVTVLKARYIPTVRRAQC